MNLIPFVEITDKAIPLPLLSNFLKIYSDKKEMSFGLVGGQVECMEDLNIRKVLTYNFSNMTKSLTDVHWSNA